MNLTDLVEDARKTSTQVSWIFAGKNAAARETRALMESCFSHIDSEKHQQLGKRIRRGDESEIDAILCELLTHELLLRRGLKPVFSPRHGSQNPDLIVSIHGVRYIVEVFETHSPTSTIKRVDGGTLSRDSGERAKKIADRMSQKAASYSDAGLPIILVVFLGDRGIDQSHMQKAVCGITINEIPSHDRFPSQQIENGLVGSLFWPSDPHGNTHSEISAIVSCDWFDTMNRDRPGKRLHCVVLHHWRPRTPAPIGFLSPFVEVSWTVNSRGHCEPRVGGKDAVARFASGLEMDFEFYSGDQPW